MTNDREQVKLGKVPEGWVAQLGDRSFDTLAGPFYFPPDDSTNTCGFLADARLTATSAMSCMAAWSQPCLRLRAWDRQPWRRGPAPLRPPSSSTCTLHSRNESRRIRGHSLRTRPDHAEPGVPARCDERRRPHDRRPPTESGRFCNDRCFRCGSRRHAGWCSRGMMRALCNRSGLISYLWAVQVPLTEFAAHALALTEQLKDASLWGHQTSSRTTSQDKGEKPIGS